MRALTLRAVPPAAGNAGDDYNHSDSDNPLAPPASSETQVFCRGDHVELGERLLADLRGRGPVVAAEGSLWLYERQPRPTGIYKVVSEDEQSRVVQSFAGLKKLTENGLSPLKVMRHDVSGAIALAHAQASQPDFFASAPTGVAFADSFVALEGTKLVKRPPSEDNRARFSYPFAFDDASKPERFLAFLNDCFRDCEDKAERVAALQQYGGVSLLGLATQYQRALVQKGEGANGKGVTSTILERAMPPGSCVAIPPQHFGNEYRLAMLAGKRLNIVNELPEVDIIDSEAFKSTIAGDPATGRHIRCAPFTFRPVAGHIFSANRLPGTTDQTHGFWRRFIVVEFPHVIPPDKQDATLADRLTEELPSIVSWLLRGAVDAAQAGRLIGPQSSAKAIGEWQRNADPVRGFLEEETEPLPLDSAPLAGAKARDLFRAYQSWALQSGHKPLSSTALGIRLGEIGVHKTTTRIGVLYDLVLAKGGVR